MSEVNSDVDIDEYDIYEDKPTINRVCSENSYENIDDITLSSLPDDIFRMIIPLIGKTDILNLRLVNKSINNKLESNLPDNISFNVSKSNLDKFNKYLISTKTTKKKPTKSILSTVANEEDNISNTDSQSIINDDDQVTCLPKSKIFDGRLIFKTKIRTTVKQLENINMNCVRVANILEVNSNIKYFKNLRCIICKRVDQNGIYQMTLLKKLNTLVITTKLLNYTPPHLVVEDSEEHRSFIRNPLLTPGILCRSTYDIPRQKYIYEYRKLNEEKINISYLNLLSNITNITLIYDGHNDFEILSYDSNKVSFKKEYEYPILKHVKKLNIDYIANKSVHNYHYPYIGFGVLYMFKNIKYLNFKCDLNAEAYYAIILMDNLEELHFPIQYVDSEITQQDFNIHAILHVILKKVKVLSIKSNDLAKNHVYNSYNTCYNYFDKYLPDKDAVIGNVISYPNIENLFISKSSRLTLDIEYPKFPNLKKLAFTISSGNLTLMESLMGSLTSLILYVESAQSYELLLTRFYEYEFPNIKELTLVVNSINCILPVHMCTNLQKLTIISRRIDNLSLHIMMCYIPHIKSIHSLRDLHITNFNKNKVTDSGYTIEEFLRKKNTKNKYNIH